MGAASSAYSITAGNVASGVLMGITPESSWCHVFSLVRRNPRDSGEVPKLAGHFVPMNIAGHEMDTPWIPRIQGVPLWCHNAAVTLSSSS